MASRDHYHFFYDYFVVQECELGHYEFLDFTFYLRHQVWIQQQQTLIPYHRYEDRLTIHTLCQEFFQTGIANLRRIVVEPALPDILLHEMMPEVVSFVRQFVENRSLNNSGERSSASAYTLPLYLSVDIDSVFAENEVIDMIVTESMNEVGMIPASEEAIRSLKKVNSEVNEKIEQCSICLEEFDNDSEVLAMPCKHSFHQPCITQWLNTSHVCPLCRYPMPKSTMGKKKLSS